MRSQRVRSLACLGCAALAAACGGAPSASPGRPADPGWVEVRFEAAALPARRGSGAVWHSGGADSSLGLFGGLLGLAVGYPELGFAIGSSLVSSPSPEAPAPIVVLKIAGDEFRLSAIGQTLAPRWAQPIAISAGRYPPEEQVVVQIIDAIDQGVLGQRELTVGELLRPGHRTWTNLGEVASLDLSVRAMPRRSPVTFEMFVDGQRSLEDLKDGEDRRWAPVPVWNGDRVTVRARGELCPSRPSPCYDADGAEPGRWSSYNYEAFSDARHASLVGVLPAQPIAIGVEESFVVRQSGLLLLFVNDTDPGNNDGGYSVEVTVEPPR